jgi:hypothetical protein
MTPAAEQAWRQVTQLGFFALFVLAPVFDLFRYDMVEKHAYLLAGNWASTTCWPNASHRPRPWSTSCCG